RIPTVGITVSRAAITLRVAPMARSEQACEELMRPTLESIRERLGDLVFGEEEGGFQPAVLSLLRERGESLAVFEWGSGGQIAHWLSESSGDEFRGGAVVRSDAAFSRRIDQGSQLLQQHGAHSRAAAEAMARQGQIDFG